VKVVVVESPAKASTIGAYLGPEYRVLASYGHVRDLREKNDSVLPEEGFRMVWEVDSDAGRRVGAIARSLKDADGLVLATDPDREGEAISWHLVETLRGRKALKKTQTVERISFHSVTRDAVRRSLELPREIDSDLVDAYLARRALDYLVGFQLSPVLMRKLPGARSAGRVQSVAVRLAVEREREIETFRKQEYWTITAVLGKPGDATFRAVLREWNGTRIGRLDIASEEQAREAERMLAQAAGFVVETVTPKRLRQRPAAPFITSTLQQEASRKLRLSAGETMRLAQKLYEAGRITYMRTDGVDMAPEAVAAVRKEIRDGFGPKYLPEKARAYKSRAKNAQEAHECIRPTDAGLHPRNLAGFSQREADLYQLIWARAVASQMADAELDRTAVDIRVESSVGADEVPGRLRASGQVVRFDGFLRLYQEGVDARADGSSGKGEDGESENRRLPPLAAGDRLAREGVDASQHFTKPPPRYTEASLVRRLEELGIGRPSTYASILSVIRKRGYVEEARRSITPTFLGRLAVGFLERHFARYVEYGFTAGLEEELDEISGGRRRRVDVLEAFWDDFAPAVTLAAKLTVRDAIAGVESSVGGLLFSPRSDGVDPHLCPKCKEGSLGLKPGRGGMFLGCDRYPDCRFVRSIETVLSGQPDWLGDRELGVDDEEHLVLVRKGPYGFYLEQRVGEKPRRVSLPAGVDPHAVTLLDAGRYLSLPRSLGRHPESGRDIQAGIGRYGPFVRCGSDYADLPAGEDVFEVGLNRAVALIEDRRAGRARGPEVLRELGEHPEQGPVRVLQGRYGPYVKWGRLSVSIPKDRDIESVTVAEVEALAAQRKARSGSRAAKAAKARSRK